MSQRTIKDFMEVTGTTKATATKYLSNNDGELNKAINLYLNSNYNPNLIKIFNKYREGNEPYIGIDGTLEYLGDLQIEPEDIESLVLSYFLRSESMGHFSKDNFINIWDNEKIYLIPEMKQFIKSLTNSMKNDLGLFKDLYSFTFKFLLENPNQKLISYETLVDYWKLLFQLLDLSQEVQTRVDQWYEFLEAFKKMVSHDSFVMFFEFLKDIIIPDPITMKDYSELSSWPSIIDEFIEYLQEKELLEEKQ